MSDKSIEEIFKRITSDQMKTDSDFFESVIRDCRRDVERWERERKQEDN
jgi:hypothetical protein